MIATDGVFSMDGYIAPLREICDLAEKYHAMVMVDDSHAVGFVGETGRGSHEHAGVMGRVDIFTGTLGKALGGASGGYISGAKPLIALLRQRSRPYLFSNSVPPSIVAASLEALKILTASNELPERLRKNTAFFRKKATDLGLQILPGEHPIVPVMVGDAAKAARMAEYLLQKGHLRDRLLVSGGADGQGAHSHAGFRRSHHRSARLGRGNVRGSRRERAVATS